MAKTEQYWQDLNAAKQGETISMDYFSSLGYSIQDVSDDSRFWSQDIDFIAHKEEKHIPIEVKFDGNIHYTGNMLLELENMSRHINGWFRFTRAEYLTIVSRVTHDIYIVRVSDLRRYMNATACRKIHNTDADGSTYESALVGIKEFRDAGYHVEIVKAVA